MSDDNVNTCEITLKAVIYKESARKFNLFSNERKFSQTLMMNNCINRYLTKMKKDFSTIFKGAGENQIETENVSHSTYCN